MRAVIGLLSSIIVVFLNPVESMFNGWGSKNKYEQLPKTTEQKPRTTTDTHTKLSAHSYFVESGDTEQIMPLSTGQARVGVLVENGIEYAIGYIGIVGTSDSKPMRPFAQGGLPTADGWGRVKIRIDDGFAYKYEMINDLATNNLFYKKYIKRDIYTFEIVRQPPPEPFGTHLHPTVAGQASPSQLTLEQALVQARQQKRALH